MPEITIGKTTLQLQGYKGIYSLVEGYMDREGKFKMNWCKRRFGETAPEMKLPVSVRCGDREGLQKLALWLLDEIEKINENVPF